MLRYSPEVAALGPGAAALNVMVTAKGVAGEVFIFIGSQAYTVNVALGDIPFNV